MNAPAVFGIHPEHNAQDPGIKCHLALIELMGAQLEDPVLLGKLLNLRAAVQTAITLVTKKIQAEHPGVLT